VALVAPVDVAARRSIGPVALRVRRVTQQLLAAILFVAVAISALFFLFVGAGPRTGHYRVVTVLTGSMRPTAPPGAMIVVTPIPLRDVRTGMVLTYHIPVLDHRVVSHRIIEVKDAGTDHPTIRTKGDANNGPDPWTATLQGTTAWRMRAAIPRLGSVVRWLRSPAVHRVSTFAVPVALAIIWLGAIWRRDGGRHRRTVGGPRVDVAQ